MFDVESAIASWRRTYLGREGATEAQADELEDHLREELDALRALARPGPAALRAEEAFLVASRRLGGSDALAAEFERCDPTATWRRRWIWMLCGYLGIGLSVTLIATLASLSAIFAYPAGAPWSLVAYVLALCVGTGAAIAIARSIARADRRLPAACARALRSNVGLVAATVAAMVLVGAVSPLTTIAMTRYVGPSMFGLMSGSPLGTLPLEAARIGLWAVPFLALAWLLSRERARFADRADPPLAR